MESNLDEKLSRVLDSYFSYSPQELEYLTTKQKHDIYLRTIEQIKQAFMEAGYGGPAAINDELLHELSDRIMSIKSNMMTGQEWYDRFKVELVKDESVSYNGDILAVARKAAGIE